jgi:mono/diheme cytochrome c family protein
MFRLVVRNATFLVALLLGLTSVAMARQSDEKSAKAAAEGKGWFRTYCASCHGEDAKGNGPVVRALKQPPPDLTTLSKRNNGKFPADYVRKVLVHGVSAPAHGTADMPIWGPTFASVNSSRLVDYLESVQTK